MHGASCQRNTCHSCSLGHKGHLFSNHLGSLQNLALVCHLAAGLHERSRRSQGMSFEYGYASLQHRLVTCPCTKCIETHLQTCKLPSFRACRGTGIQRKVSPRSAQASRQDPRSEACLCSRECGCINLNFRRLRNWETLAHRHDSTVFDACDSDK